MSHQRVRLSTLLGFAGILFFLYPTNLAAEGSGYPIGYVDRPLTIQQGLANGNSVLTYERACGGGGIVTVGGAGPGPESNSSDLGSTSGALSSPECSDSWGMVFGAAYGVTDDLEFGLTLLTLSISPEFALGDNAAYLAYRFAAVGDFEAATLGQVQMLNQTTNGKRTFDFNFSLALPMTLKIGQAQVAATPSLFLPLEENNVRAAGLSTRLTYSFSTKSLGRLRESIALALLMDVVLPDFKTDSRITSLGIGSLYSLAGLGFELIDLGFSFVFPTFLVKDTMNTDNWQMMVTIFFWDEKNW